MIFCEGSFGRGERWVHVVQEFSVIAFVFVVFLSRKGERKDGFVLFVPIVIVLCRRDGGTEFCFCSARVTFVLVGYEVCVGYWSNETETDEAH